MKRVIALLLALALVFGATACGTKDNKTNDTAPTQAATPTTAATPTPGDDKPAEPTPTEAPAVRPEVHVAVLK